MHIKFSSLIRKVFLLMSFSKVFLLMSFSILIILSFLDYMLHFIFLYIMFLNLSPVLQQGEETELINTQ